MMSSSFIPMKINIFSSDIGFLPNFWYFPNWTQFSFFNILLYYIIYAYPLTNEMIINWRASPRQANNIFSYIFRERQAYKDLRIIQRVCILGRRCLRLDLWRSRTRPQSRPDFLVFVHSVYGWWANLWDTQQESQGGNKEFGNPGRRGRRWFMAHDDMNSWRHKSWALYLYIVSNPLPSK